MRLPPVNTLLAEVRAAYGAVSGLIATAFAVGGLLAARQVAP